MGFRRATKWPRVPHAEIVKRTKVLVIDDAEFPYLKLFKRDGYNIEKWPDVKDLQALERGAYDVVLLDLQGVGQALSPDQGLGVLGHLRQVHPAQIVIAYSNAEWSVEYQDFLRSADAVLHKTKDDYMVFKRTVDQLLDKRFSLGFYIDRIARELGDAAATDRTLEKARKAILKGDADGLRKYLSTRVDDAVTIDRVISVVGVAISAAQLWTS